MEAGPPASRKLVLMIAAEVAAVVALHRLGGVDGFAIPRHDLGRWLQQTPSEDVLLACIRLAALATAWWLLGSTLLYVTARAARFRRTARALRWATLPAVRRWADRAAAVSIVAASALGAARPAGADPPPTTTTSAPVVVEVDHRPRAGRPDLPPSAARTGRGVHPPPPTVAPPIGTAPVLPAPAPPVPPVPEVPPSVPSPDGTHTVRPGEHLWSIAAATVAARTGRSADALSPADIAPFWKRLVERNRGHLRSGNPDLVYPGEVLELPPR